MRTVFTALAFLVILWAIVPAVRRSLVSSHNKADADSNQSYTQK
jgi:hypothetical protein